MKYVNNESASKAREMELRFQALPKAAGILFVGVEPVAAEGGQCREFAVHMGLARRLASETGYALIKNVLEAELKNEISIYAHVYRGVAGAGRDEDSEGARPPAS